MTAHLPETLAHHFPARTANHYANRKDAMLTVRVQPDFNANLARAAQALGMSKSDLVRGLVEIGAQALGIGATLDDMEAR